MHQPFIQLPVTLFTVALVYNLRRYAHSLGYRGILHVSYIVPNIGNTLQTGLEVPGSIVHSSVAYTYFHWMYMCSYIELLYV